MRGKLAFALGIAFSVAAPSIAAPPPPPPLSELTAKAAELCARPDLYGYERTAGGKITGHLNLPKLFGKMPGGGVAADAQVQFHDWQGVLQQDAAKALSDSNTCRANMFSLMFKTFYSREAAPQTNGHHATPVKKKYENAVGVLRLASGYADIRYRNDDDTPVEINTVEVGWAEGKKVDFVTSDGLSRDGEIFGFIVPHDPPIIVEPNQTKVFRLITHDSISIADDKALRMKTCAIRVYVSGGVAEGVEERIGCAMVAYTTFTDLTDEVAKYEAEEAAEEAKNAADKQAAADNTKTAAEEAAGDAVQ